MNIIRYSLSEVAVYYGHPEFFELPLHRQLTGEERTKALRFCMSGRSVSKYSFFRVEYGKDPTPLRQPRLQIDWSAMRDDLGRYAFNEDGSPLPESEVIDG